MSFGIVYRIINLTLRFIFEKSLPPSNYPNRNSSIIYPKKAMKIHSKNFKRTKYICRTCRQTIVIHTALEKERKRKERKKKKMLQRERSRVYKGSGE